MQKEAVVEGSAACFGESCHGFFVSMLPVELVLDREVGTHGVVLTFGIGRGLKAQHKGHTVWIGCQPVCNARSGAGENPLLLWPLLRILLWAVVVFVVVMLSVASVDGRKRLPISLFIAFVPQRIDPEESDGEPRKLLVGCRGSCRSGWCQVGTCNVSRGKIEADNLFELIYGSV